MMYPVLMQNTQNDEDVTRDDDDGVEYLEDVQAVGDGGKDETQFGSELENYAWRKQTCGSERSIQNCIAENIND